MQRKYKENYLKKKQKCGCREGMDKSSVVLPRGAELRKLINVNEKVSEGRERKSQR